MERKWWTLIAVCVATFMLLIDVTIVNVALPSIQADLGREPLEPAVGRRRLRADPRLVPARRSARSATGSDAGGSSRSASRVFTFASLLCGLAKDPTVLNLCRGLQGVGARGDVRHRARADRAGVRGPRARPRRSASGARRVGGAVAIGPLIGGVITDGLGWEWIFFVNVPIGLAAIVLTETKLANVAATDPEPIDCGGLVTFSLALFAPDLRPDPRQRRGLGIAA